MTGFIPSIPGFGSSSDTRPAAPTHNGNGYLPSRLTTDYDSQDRFCGSGSSSSAEPSWTDRAVGFFRSIGESLRLIDPQPKQAESSGDVFGSP